MNSIYNHAVKQSTTVRKELEEFENNITNAPLSLIGSLTTSLSQLAKTISDYEESINKQYMNDRDSIKRDKNLNKLDTLQAQLREFKSTFQVFKKQRDSNLEIQSKQQLFERKTGSVSDNPYSHAQEDLYLREQQLLYEDGMLNEHDKLRSGNEQLDHILEMLSLSYENIVSQNRFLSQMNDKLTDTYTNLKLSGLTLNKIEKKMKEDKFFFYGGCGFVLFMFILILKYFG